MKINGIEYNETACSYCLLWYENRERHHCKVKDLKRVIDNLDQRHCKETLRLEKKIERLKRKNSEGKNG